MASLVVVAVTAVMVTAAQSGHEFPVYPSYYPHEIRIEALEPGRAAQLLLSGTIQAYVGREPQFAKPPPASLTVVESLGDFVVVRVNRQSPRIRDRASACAAAEAGVRQFAAGHKDFVFHPYPITPLQGDYLYHADLADAAKARIHDDRTRGNASEWRGLKLRSAQVDGGASHPDTSAEWDVAVEHVDFARLLGGATAASNGWVAPPWGRDGWYAAVLLLEPTLDAPGIRERVRTDLNRLQSGSYANTVERINVERELVSDLTHQCAITVAGYTLKREYLSSEYAAGIENIAFDAIEGLNTPMFIRTAKLKDFPWNGWLSLGVGAPPAAAWNPVAGFTDPFGRLMWSAVGDPALIPAPNDAGWILNRVADVQSSPAP